MAEKDTVEKILLAHNDVFADLVNVLLFHGKEVVRTEELTEQAPRSAYKTDGKIREIERDVAKRWTRRDIRIACIGLENQTTVDPDLPLRILGYDGAEYRAELNNKRKERYPVITLVLYFGYKKRWDGPTALLERLDVPEEFLPYVNDYRINLFEIAFLEEEQVKLFKSDFGIVAEYFVKMRKGESDDYRGMCREFDHVQETLQLLSTMTNDHRFEELCEDNGKEVPKTMCEALDQIQNKGFRLGRSEGADMVAALMQTLFESGRVADAKRAAEDRDYRNQLLEEFNLARK